MGGAKWYRKLYSDILARSCLRNIRVLPVFGVLPDYIFPFHGNMSGLLCARPLVLGHFYVFRSLSNGLILCIAHSSMAHRNKKT